MAVPITLHEAPVHFCDVAPVDQVLSARLMAQSSFKLDNGMTLVRCFSRREAFVVNKPVIANTAKTDNTANGKACLFDEVSIAWENHAWHFRDSKTRKFAARSNGKGQCPLVDYREQFYPGQQWTEVSPEIPLDTAMQIKNMAELSGLAMLRKAGFTWGAYRDILEDKSRLHALVVEDGEMKECLPELDTAAMDRAAVATSVIDKAVTASASTARLTHCYRAVLSRRQEWMTFGKYQDGSIRFTGKKTGAFCEYPIIAIPPAPPMSPVPPVLPES
ncbi:hypothetical protein ACO0LG_16735 [Undibacterium sp. Ji42W]|uniref:hypothetical protein n=1 Tax=Undibacterium sp. Ji42W TaxID=3413039 RepID=UPI003BF41301